MLKKKPKKPNTKVPQHTTQFTLKSLLTWILLWFLYSLHLGVVQVHNTKQCD